MKFVLFVEGHTEKRVLAPLLKRWLDPQLKQPIGFQVIRFDGWRNYLKEIANKVAITFRESKPGDVIAAFGLLDLYGPDFYPNNARTADDRFQWAKDKIEHTVSHSNFTQWFAVHELEAWLLAEPSLFPSGVKKALLATKKEPETVNFHEPPAKLLARLYDKELDAEYRKTIDGKKLFERLNPDAAYKRCPRLAQMLDHMLNTARAAGL